MSLKKGFTLLEVGVDIFLTSISLSVFLSFFYQMSTVSVSYFKEQVIFLERSLGVLELELKLRSKCPCEYTAKETRLQKENKIKAANRCRLK